MSSHFFCRAIVSTSLWLSTSAYAFTPESGWWWNEAEAGRGFSIEVQDNTLFMAGFLYESDGDQQWFIASGRYLDSSERFDAEMFFPRAGQCFTCSPRAPTVPPSTMRISITFESPTAGVVTWPGGVTRIKRNVYGLALDIERLNGTHAFSSSGSSGRVHFGNWVNFNRTDIDPTLGKIALGSTESGRLVVASFGNAARTSIILLIDSSTSFYDYYIFPTSYLGTREGFGLWATFPKAGSIPSAPNALGHIVRLLPSNAGPSLSASSAPKHSKADISLALQQLRSIAASAPKAP
jgi:hypothetical protein